MPTLTRKIQIVPVGNSNYIKNVYTYLRKGIDAQNQAMNQYMSSLYVAEITKQDSEYKKELKYLYGRNPDSKLGSAYLEDMEFAKGLATPSCVTQRVKSAFNKAKKDGLMKGKVSLPTYRADNPLIVNPIYIRLRKKNEEIYGKHLGMYHCYDNHEDFVDNILNKKDPEIYISFANGITFKLVFGNINKSQALRSEIKNVFEEYYDIGGSSIQFSGTKIILNLCLEIPEKKIELDENIVVGVDLGLAIPAYCALNTNNYIRKSIGSKDDFLRVRTKIQAQRRNLQSQIASSNGGHGRKKKMKPMERFREYESHWVQNYNHYVSKQVVDFAVQNKAKYINLENLKGFGDSITEDDNGKKEYHKRILSSWSYYQLQQYITYKAMAYGIEVRKVNPYHTSQICSECGEWHPKNRLDQSHFVCQCCGSKMNADFNAARNISMSTDFQLEKTTLEEKKISHEKSKSA